MLNTYKKEIYKIVKQKEMIVAFFAGPVVGQRIYNLLNKTHLFDDLLLDDRIDHTKKFLRNTFHQLYFMSSWYANFLHQEQLLKISCRCKCS